MLRIPLVLVLLSLHVAFKSNSVKVSFYASKGVYRKKKGTNNMTELVL